MHRVEPADEVDRRDDEGRELEEAGDAGHGVETVRGVDVFLVIQPRQRHDVACDRHDLRRGHDDQRDHGLARPPVDGDVAGELPSGATIVADTPVAGGTFAPGWR